MPYSQTHLAAACSLIDRPAIQSVYPWLMQPPNRAAYYLGLIGPDARVVAGIPREVTHFYEIPRQEARPIHRVVMERCPELHRSGHVTQQNQAFAAGYLAHLTMDVVWLETIVMPRLFIEGQDWKPGHPNWQTYNLLMGYLEVHGSKHLCSDVLTLLPQVQPEAWIACLSDDVLTTWGAHIARVVHESGPQHVITLLARSSGVPVTEFEHIVHSHERVFDTVGPTVTPPMITSFLEVVEQRSVEAIIDYLRETT